MLKNIYQRKLLSTCSFFSSGAKYSDLSIKDLDNDLYNYHLQQLVKIGYLSKQDKIYKLTQKGKSYVTNIDEISIDKPPTYKVSVYLCVIKEDKILLHKRLKHPQYGYIGLPSGKIKYGESILETAKRELLEETDLSADFDIIGNIRQIRKDKDGKVIEDGVFYVCFTDDFTGDLKTKFIEGENFWHSLDDVSNLDKIFKPSLEVVVDEIKRQLANKGDSDTQFIYEFEPEPEEY